jgi:hypothetical protein
MRPHNGWWRASSAPRRWIDLVQDTPRWVATQAKQASQPAALAAKPVQTPTV